MSSEQWPRPGVATRGKRDKDQKGQGNKTHHTKSSVIIFPIFLVWIPKQLPRTMHPGRLVSHQQAIRPAAQLPSGPPMGKTPQNSTVLVAEIMRSTRGNTHLHFKWGWLDVKPKERSLD